MPSTGALQSIRDQKEAVMERILDHAFGALGPAESPGEAWMAQIAQIERPGVLAERMFGQLPGER